MSIHACCRRAIWKLMARARQRGSIQGPGSQAASWLCHRSTGAAPAWIRLPAVRWLPSIKGILPYDKEPFQKMNWLTTQIWGTFSEIELTDDLNDQDPFQKLDWLTTSYKGSFRKWTDLLPNHEHFQKEIWSVRPIYGLSGSRCRSVRPIYELFIGKSGSCDPKGTLIRRSRAEKNQNFKCSRKSQILKKSP